MLESYRYLFGVAAVALLLLPSVPGLGERVNGVRLWVSVGPLQFQPGELAKICLILFLAGYLREKREVLAQGRLKDLGPLVAIWGAAMLVIVQTNDLGSALLNFGIFLAMLYVATGAGALRRAPVSRSSSAARPSSTTRSTTSRTASRSGCTRGRTSASTARSTGSSSTGRTAPRTSSSRASTRSRTAASGAPGSVEGTFTSVDGTQLIPYLRTDFIFSAIAQELGLIGAAALLLVFMVFVVRGMRVALQAQDGFSKLLAAGLTFGFALQTFIIVGGVLRVVPLTGITLPFVSYGGTSIVANFVLLALLLLVSNRANTPR